MALEDPSYIYDYTDNLVRPVSTSTWSALSGTTWDDWSEWAYSTADQIRYPLETYQFPGINKPYVNFKITCTSTGSMSYRVYTTTGEIGDPATTEYIIENGASNVPAFSANRIFVMAYADKINGITPVITNLRIELVESSSQEIQIANLDSSTCDGTQTARVIPISDDTISTITDIKITPRETATPYNLDVYVTNTPTSTYLIPKIISKSLPSPTFALVGVDNHPRDGIVDITIKTLPRFYMDGNSVVSA